MQRIGINVDSSSSFLMAMVLCCVQKLTCNTPYMHVKYRTDTCSGAGCWLYAI
jgi:hypothetical protein